MYARARSAISSSLQGFAFGIGQLLTVES